MLITSGLRFDFMSFVLKSEGCWQWIGGIDSGGYGHFNSRIYGNYSAHRLSYAIAHDGIIDDNLDVLHTCDKRDCVNPSHLYQGTAKDNYADAKNKNRHCHGKTHGNSLITEITAMKIYLKACLGIPHRDIAKEFGISKSQVTRIYNKEAWAHIHTTGPP